MKRFALTCTSVLALAALAACSTTTSMEHANHNACDAVTSVQSGNIVTSAAHGTVVTHKHPDNCNILFDTGSAAIRSIYITPLNTLAGAMEDGNVATITLVGNADVRGSVAANNSLSKRRANAIKDYLVRQGVDASKISIEYNGELSPVADGNSAEALQLNRNVQLVFNY